MDLPGPTLVAIMIRHFALTADSCYEGKVLSPKYKQQVLLGWGAGDGRQGQGAEGGGMSGGTSACP